MRVLSPVASSSFNLHVVLPWLLVEIRSGGDAVKCGAPHVYVVTPAWRGWYKRAMGIAPRAAVVILVLSVNVACSDERSVSSSPTRLGQPSLTQVSPAWGPVAGDRRVSIIGTSFLPGATVTFNGVEALDVSVVSTTLIRAITPPGVAGPADVVVANVNGRSSRVAAGYVYEAPPRAVRSIRVSGPASIAPGGTGQFTAIAEYEDGGSADVTATALWSSQPAGFIRFGAAGLAVTLARGETTVTARLQHTSPPLNVTVLEAGTYRLSGTVINSGQGVASATVEVIDGTGTGLRTITPYGAFALYGVAGVVTVRISAVDFEPLTQTLAVDGNTSRDFEVRPTITPLDVAGHWSLTLSASPACSATLAEPLRERRFDADIIQQGPRLTFTLSGATLIGGDGPIQFEGRVVDRALSLALPAGRPFFDNMLLEQLPAGGYFALTGAIEASVGDREIQGTLTGEFARYDLVGTPPRLEATSSCRPGPHSVVLRR
jgi:IPT/TIG domain